MSAIEDRAQFEMGEGIPAGNPQQQCESIEVETFAVENDADDIDWEELAREAHADFQTGNLSFVATHDDPVQARAALKRYLDDILEEVLHETATSSGAEVACP